MPILSYFNDVPQPNAEPSDSQPMMLTNFASIQTLIEVNHETFGVNDYGKHKFVTMPNQVASPDTGPNEGALWCAASSPGIADLFFRRQDNEPAINITRTNGVNYTYLPSGILVKWGQGSTSNYAGVGVNAPVVFTGPAFTGVPIVLVTVVATANDIANANRTAVLANGSTTIAQFQVNCFRLSDFASTSCIFNWMAIGL